MAGAFEDARIELSAVPAYLCGAAGHPAKWVHDEFGMQLTERLQYHDVFPYPVPGLLGAKCRGCNARLRGSPKSIERLETTFALAGFEALGVRLSASAIRCNACGFVQFSDDHKNSFHVSEAIRLAFEQVPLQP